MVLNGKLLYLVLNDRTIPDFKCNSFSIIIIMFIAQSRVRIEEILDPVLNVMVLVAQTQAGMWRRNGYSLISQVMYTNL